MTPIITDEVTGVRLLTSMECVAKAGIAIGTWRAYVALRNAPKPVAKLDGRTPLWREGEVLQWVKSRAIVQ